MYATEFTPERYGQTPKQERQAAAYAAGQAAANWDQNPMDLAELAYADGPELCEDFCLGWDDALQADMVEE